MRLTPKQIAIMDYLVSGKKNEEIADLLNLSHYTIRNHIANIYNKLRVHNRVQATLWYQDYKKGNHNELSSTH